MARIETEYAFVSGFWAHAAEETGYAARIAANVQPQHLEHQAPRVLYGLLSEGMLVEGGAATNNVELVQAAIRMCPPEEQGTISDIWHTATLHVKPPQLGAYVTSILAASTAREQRQLLTSAAQVATDHLHAHDYAAVSQTAEDAAMRLYAIGAERPGRARIRSREEISAELLAAIDAPAAGGVVWPWPRLTRVLGLLARGDVVGITGEAGAGKSTLLTALFAEWTRRNVPCIVFSTEMRAKFLNRAYAGLAGVPQLVAEQELFNPRDLAVLRMLSDMWGCSTEVVRVRCSDYAEKYRSVVKEWQSKPWEVVELADLSPEELMGHLRVIRRRYGGAQVVVMVDHMLNLRYEGGHDALQVGPASRRIRELCQEDQEGGLSAVLLYQPRKADTGAEDRAKFAPVSAGRVIGGVARVLDRHMSVYLRYVKTQPYGLTEWGTRPCAYDERGTPEFGGSEGEPGCKIDDEHVYIKVDKNRTGGPSPTQILDFHQPSGRIYEAAHQQEASRAA